MLVALPFGTVALLVVLGSWMLLGREVVQTPAVALMLGLFMVAAGPTVGSCLRPALRWGGGAAGLATIMLLAGMLILGDRVESLEKPWRAAMAAIGAAWLVAIAVAAWAARSRRQLLAPMLAAVVATSGIAIYPALGLYTLVSEAGNVILVPMVIAAIAAGVLGVLLLGAVVAWFAKAFRRWVAPEAVVGVLAAIAFAAVIAVRFA